MSPHSRLGTAGGIRLVCLLAAALSLFQGLPVTSAEAAPPPSPAAANPAVGVPAVSLGLPATVFIGQAFTFTVTFDNTSATDTGYGPFIDLLFPVND